jgi:hypothetical protein
MTELIIEFVLYMVDGVLDLVTLGRWSRWQGEKSSNVKIKQGWK